MLYVRGKFNSVIIDLAQCILIPFVLNFISDPLFVPDIVLFLKFPSRKI